MQSLLKRIAGIAVSVVISTGLGATLVPLAPSQSERPPAQELASAHEPLHPETRPAPPTPTAVQKAELADEETWAPTWDGMIEEALPSELLSPKVAKAAT